MFGHVRTCSGHVLDMFWTCFGHVLDMFRTCFRHVPDMFRACFRRVSDIFRTFFNNFRTFCSGHSVLDILFQTLFRTMFRTLFRTFFSGHCRGTTLSVGRSVAGPLDHSCVGAFTSDRQSAIRGIIVMPSRVHCLPNVDRIGGIYSATR